MARTRGLSGESLASTSDSVSDNDCALATAGTSARTTAARTIHVRMGNLRMWVFGLRATVYGLADRPQASPSDQDRKVRGGGRESRAWTSGGSWPCVTMTKVRGARSITGTGANTARGRAGD